MALNRELIARSVWPGEGKAATGPIPRPLAAFTGYDTPDPWEAVRT